MEKAIFVGATVAVLSILAVLWCLALGVRPPDWLMVPILAGVTLCFGGIAVDAIW